MAISVIFMLSEAQSDPRPMYNWRGTQARRAFARLLSGPHVNYPSSQLGKPKKVVGAEKHFTLPPPPKKKKGGGGGGGGGGGQSPPLTHFEATWSERRESRELQIYSQNRNWWDI